MAAATTRHTIEAFSGRLHQPVHLGHAHGELLALVDETMQPTRASLWLGRRSPPPPAGR